MLAYENGELCLWHQVGGHEHSCAFFCFYRSISKVNSHLVMGRKVKALCPTRNKFHSLACVVDRAAESEVTLVLCSARSCHSVISAALTDRSPDFYSSPRLRTLLRLQLRRCSGRQPQPGALEDPWRITGGGNGSQSEQTNQRQMEF